MSFDENPEDEDIHLLCGQHIDSLEKDRDHYKSLAKKLSDWNNHLHATVKRFCDGEATGDELKLSLTSWPTQPDYKSIADKMADAVELVLKGNEYHIHKSAVEMLQEALKSYRAAGGKDGV